MAPEASWNAVPTLPPATAETVIGSSESMQVVGQHAGAGCHVENGVLIDGAAAVVDRGDRLGRHVDRDVDGGGGNVAVGVGGGVAEAVGNGRGGRGRLDVADGRGVVAVAAVGVERQRRAGGQLERGPDGAAGNRRDGDRVVAGWRSLASTPVPAVTLRTVSSSTVLPLSSTAVTGSAGTLTVMFTVAVEMSPWPSAAV